MVSFCLGNAADFVGERKGLREVLESVFLFEAFAFRHLPIATEFLKKTRHIPSGQWRNATPAGHTRFARQTACLHGVTLLS
jgi:hypothetical protein